MSIFNNLINQTSFNSLDIAQLEFPIEKIEEKEAMKDQLTFFEEEDEWQTPHLTKN